MLRGGEEYDAGKTTIGQVDERDWICYLFDYGDEWRFYAILKETDKERSSGIEPDVAKKKRDPAKQYSSSDEGW